MFSLIKYALDLFLNILSKLCLNKFWNFFSIKTVTITDSEEMSPAIFGEMRQRQKRILIDLVWVGWLKTCLCGESKLRNAIVKLYCSCICLLWLISDNLFCNGCPQSLIACLIKLFSPFDYITFFCISFHILRALRWRVGNFLRIRRLLSIQDYCFTIRVCSIISLANKCHSVDFMWCKRPLVCLLLHSLRLSLFNNHVPLNDRFRFVIRLVRCCI